MSEQPTSQPGSVKFYYIKSNFFRVVHGDGVVGGITPNGKIHFGFFSQRHPFPQQTSHALKEGTVGAELLETRVSKDGVIREIEVDIVMDLEVSISVRDWLDRHIKILKGELK